jgi:hypothetical protein
LLGFIDSVFPAADKVSRITSRNGRGDRGRQTVSKKWAPEGEKRQFLTTMDPDVIRAIKQVALDLDRTASDVMEEAAKQWLARHKHKK